jgi:hypothetical protein
MATTKRKRVWVAPRRGGYSAVTVERTGRTPRTGELVPPKGRGAVTTADTGEEHVVVTGEQLRRILSKS